MVDLLNFGVIGTGQIAAEFAEALARSRRCRIVNVAGSSREKAALFAARAAIPRSADSVEALVGDERVEAVYVATPHPRHTEHVLAAIAAGKHVLCEKPLTLDVASTERLIGAARARGVFLMEAYMYRSHPLLCAVIERVRAGAIGTPRFLRSSFGFRTRFEPKSRLFAPELGGGCIFDVGGYPVSLARLCAGLARNAELDEPISVQGSGRLAPTGADELAIASLRFASGFVADVACATRFELGTETVLFGETGRIVLADPWLPDAGRQGLESSFWIHRDGADPELVSVRAELSTFALEAELVLDTLPKLEAPWPAMAHADSVGNARVLHTWLEQVRRA